MSLICNKWFKNRNIYGFRKVSIVLAWYKLPGIIKGYYEQGYDNKFNDLDEIDQCIEEHKSSTNRKYIIGIVLNLLKILINNFPKRNH